MADSTQGVVIYHTHDQIDKWAQFRRQNLEDLHQARIYDLNDQFVQQDLAVRNKDVDWCALSALQRAQLDLLNSRHDDEVGMLEKLIDRSYKESLILDRDYLEKHADPQKQIHITIACHSSTEPGESSKRVSAARGEFNAVGNRIVIELTENNSITFTVSEGDKPGRVHKLTLER
jgi:hypothetical protein